MKKIRGFTDIHCHLLYNVDDGAKSLEESQKMITLAYENDTRRMICTPHYGQVYLDADFEKRWTHFQVLQAWVSDTYPDMKLYMGQEIKYFLGLIDEIRLGRIQTLANSRYLLIEFDEDTSFKTIRQALATIQMAGYIPILAHMERYQAFYDKKENIELLMDMNIHVQINADSYLGKCGFRYKRMANYLLKKGYVDYLASDGHDLKKRKPELKKAVLKISREYGKAYAWQISVINPEKILNNTGRKSIK